MTSRQLKIARDKLGLSQVKLAKKLKVCVYSISKWENYDKPPRESGYGKKIPHVVDLAMRHLLSEAR